MAEITLTDATFKEETGKDGLLLVDFWAPWCPPCKLLGPIIEEVGKELEGQVTIGKVNVDENPQVSGEYQIMSIPTVMLFKNGSVIEQVVGLRDKGFYVDLVKRAQKE